MNCFYTWQASLLMHSVPRRDVLGLDSFMDWIGSDDCYIQNCIGVRTCAYY